METLIEPFGIHVILKTKYPSGLDSFDAFPVHPDSSNKFVKIFQTKTL